MRAQKQIPECVFSSFKWWNYGSEAAKDLQPAGPRRCRMLGEVLWPGSCEVGIAEQGAVSGFVQHIVI